MESAGTGEWLKPLSRPTRSTRGTQRTGFFGARRTRNPHVDEAQGILMGPVGSFCARNHEASSISGYSCRPQAGEAERSVFASV